MLASTGHCTGGCDLHMRLTAQVAFDALEFIPLANSFSHRSNRFRSQDQ
jgi:hypothetical protein